MLSRVPGNYVFRVPVSGGRTAHNSRTAFPDVFLVNNEIGEIVAFEVKSTSSRKVRVKREQLVKLFKFLDAFKRYERRVAVVAVWFTSESRWVFRKVEESFPLTSMTVSCEDESDWEPPGLKL